MLVEFYLTKGKPAILARNRNMMPTALEEDAEFKLRFDGQLNQINASTLGYSLVNIATIVSEISQEVDTVARIEIKVNATLPGSFLVHLSLESVLEGVFQLLGPEGTTRAGAAAVAIIKTLAEVFKLRKVLKGDPPQRTTQQEEKYEIQGRDNAIIVIDKRTYRVYFDHPEVNEALSKTFKALEADPSIERFEIADEKDTVLFDATRDDFQQMALSTSVPQPERKEIREETWVYIVKPSFERKLKWDVLYKGMRIPVTLKDQGFLDRVESGEKFSKGDTLLVTLRIEQHLDKNLRTYVNKKYEILEVKKHVPREEQTSLFDEK